MSAELSEALADAAAGGVDLSSNAFLLVHGWTAGPLLLEFVATFLRPLTARPMTAAELAQGCGAEEGPVLVVLRACHVLGYVELRTETGVYSVAPSGELEALAACLEPGASCAEALRGIFSEAAPPFKIPSEAADRCLRAWATERPVWRRSKSQALATLLDGVVLAPLLTSITYFARWSDVGLDMGKGAAMERFDFGHVEAASRALLEGIFEELGVGSMDPDGVVRLSSKGSLALQRCYAYYVPTSYSPTLAQLRRILFEDAGWGFAGQDAEEAEAHVERTLNVVGSGAQHQTFFKDFMRHIDAVFGGESFASQPAFVVDTGSGDGQLLTQIYEHVKASTPRGERLGEYPLTMVGVDLNEESRVATAINLSKRGIPHIVLPGDIAKPIELMAALKKRKVDLSRTLHVRSFLDHDRPYLAPVRQLREDSAAGRFARAQLADAVHLSKDGKRIGPLDAFESLAEHLGRWGDALQGSFGLCVLEVMALDVATTRRHLRDSVAFHFDIVQSLSRQYVTSPSAFCMAAAMAGLFPAKVKDVQTYPEQGDHCRALSQHLVRKPHRIRLAEVSDLPSLERLESAAWAENLRAPAEALRTRLETPAATNLVCELDGRVVAVLYTQLVESLAVVETQRFASISSTHSPAGRIMQLVAIATDPEVGRRGIGSDLRALALLLARVHPQVDSVIGVTRARDFKSFSGSMEAYVERHVAGELTDPIIGFHTGFGAQVVGVVRDFRPEDVDNQGHGVLIQYRVKDLAQGDRARVGPGDAAATTPSVELIARVMEEIGYPLDRGNLARGFFDYGMDSLELVRIRNKLSAALSTDLPATLLLDFPTARDLAAQLDRDRGVELGAAAAEAAAVVQEPRLTWNDLGVRELLDIQDRSKRVYALPQYQRKFTDLAKRCYPDMMKYILAVESVLVEVEGAIFHDFGLIDEMSWQAVQHGRSQMVNCMMKYWVEVPQIRARCLEILHLTKQDQVWDG